MSDLHAASRPRTPLGTLPTQRDETARLAALADYRLIPLGEMSDAEVSEQLLGDLQGLAEVATRLTGSQAAVFNIISDTHQHQIAAWNVAPAVCRRGDSMCAVAFQSGRTVVVPDASLDPRYSANPFVTGRISNIKFYASTPMIVPGGHVVGTLCVFDTIVRDITEEQEEGLRLLADQAVQVMELSRRTRLLDAAVQRLTTTNELLAGFAGRVSHDLRTPVGDILGLVGALAGVPAVGANPAARDRLATIEASCRRMERTIGDLLEYAAAGEAVGREPVDVTVLLDEVRQELSGPIRDAGADVTLSARPGLTLPGDPAQLRRLLRNLVSNAIRYRRTDGRPRVIVSAQATLEWWQLRVADNGPGIPAEHRETVRQPLARLPRDESGEGTGIGLATCERIATGHGGTLEISDTPEGGATITLRVPIHPGEAAGSATGTGSAGSARSDESARSAGSVRSAPSAGSAPSAPSAGSAPAAPSPGSAPAVGRTSARSGDGGGEGSGG
jgi:signal transduction histidine kinase